MPIDDDFFDVIVYAVFPWSWHLISPVSLATHMAINNFPVANSRKVDYNGTIRQAFLPF